MTRSKRGWSVRRQIQANTTPPSNWSAFLKLDDNKSELFAYLSSMISTLDIPTGKQVIPTVDDNVLCNPSRESIATLSPPCGHEEADTRLLLHVRDAEIQGYRTVMLRTVDTDAVFTGCDQTSAFAGRGKKTWCGRPGVYMMM